MAGYAAWDVSITAEGNDIYEKNIEPDKSY